MQMLVRADIRRGAMQEDGVPANVTEGCTCDLQFKAKECRQWLLRDTRNASKPQPCPSARVVYIGVYTHRKVIASRIIDVTGLARAPLPICNLLAEAVSSFACGGPPVPS